MMEPGGLEEVGWGGLGCCGGGLDRVGLCETARLRWVPLNGV